MLSDMRNSIVVAFIHLLLYLMLWNNHEASVVIGVISAKEKCFVVAGSAHSRSVMLWFIQSNAFMQVFLSKQRLATY